MSRLEQVLGIIAGAWGVAVLAFFLAGPVYRTATNSTGGTTHTGTASGIQVGISPVAIIFLAVVTLALIGIAVTAFQDGRGLRGYRGWLWAATAVFGAYCLLALLSIGVLLLPGLVCAIVASVLAGVKHPATT